MTGSEYEDYSKEPNPRLSLSEVAPADLFTWLKADINRSNMNNSVALRRLYADDMLEPLEQYITRHFSTALPELIVATDDAFHTKRIQQNASGVYEIESEEWIREKDDAQSDAVYAHTIVEGTLYGFCKGDKDELRILITDRTQPEVVLPGGVYRPLVSARVDGSAIGYAQSPEETYRTLGLRTKEQVSTSENPLAAHKLYVELIAALNESGTSSSQKLGRSSDILSRFNATLPDFENTSLMVNLIEIIKYKLRLHEPQTIITRSHHVEFEDMIIKAYRIKGRETFKNVEPAFGMVGVTNARKLGIFFIYGEDKKAVRFPVDFIEHIAPTEQ